MAHLHRHSARVMLSNDSMPESEFTNALGQYTLLTEEVLIRTLGVNWTRSRQKLDFSDDNFLLETLVGPARGIMHEKMRMVRDTLEILNISKNNLTDINCLNDLTLIGTPEFRMLLTLNASRNSLLSAKLEINSLMEVNLSHNQLGPHLPQIHLCPNLRRLLLSHNQLNAELAPLCKNTKLTVLDLSHNKFSWKPSIFKRQTAALAATCLEELHVWPNPFAEHFKEYQFLAAMDIDSLQLLDNWPIERDVRDSLRQEHQDVRGQIDYTVFDISVEERRRLSAPVQKQSGSVDRSQVPCLQEMLDLLDQALDHPDTIMKCMEGFQEMVALVLGARFSDRPRVMELRTIQQFEEYQIRAMRPEEEEMYAKTFYDKIQQMLGRFESCRDVIISSCAKLMACGCDELAGRCAVILAEWIEANAQDLLPNIDHISWVILREIRARMLQGMQSISESPTLCYEASFRPEKDAASKTQVAMQSMELEDMAEAACILRALSRFGSLTLYDKCQTPLHSLVLRVFVPALCRETRVILGEDQPRDAWSAYPQFDAMQGAEDVEVLDEQRGNVPAMQERCIRMGLHGFVVEDTEEGSTTVKVRFKRLLPESLVGMRRTHPRRTLHVRPHGEAADKRRRGNSRISRSYAWDVWFYGLAVLVAATEDTENAAMSVRNHGVHWDIVLHVGTAGDESNGQFSEMWISSSSEETDEALTLILRLAQNLSRASGDACWEAVRHFVESKLHLNCWFRARKRLLQAGRPVPLGSLKALPPGETSLIAALLGTVCCLARGGQGAPPSRDDRLMLEGLMKELVETGLDVFYAVVEILADSHDVPEPLLMTSALEMLHVFLESDVTRPVVLAGGIVAKLRDMATLLPYLRGPKQGHRDNPWYQDLWRECEVKYGSKSSARERRPEIYAKDAGAVWKSYVPDLKDLQHPLMLKVVLRILMLFELFSDKAPVDPTGILRVITEALDEAGRDEILIKPASGLVNCPDFDVKIHCMRCIKQVLHASVAQFTQEEMGYLIRYLTPVGIGVGKQEEFLKQVLGLLAILTRHTGPTGRTFRLQYGKAAIRESFDILRVNTRRMNSGSIDTDQEKRALELSLAATQFLKDCSWETGGFLRKFLRRLDFMRIFTEVICLEDRTDKPRFRRELLGTFTGRAIAQILLPLTTGSELRLHGITRYRLLVRMADVLQGKQDYSPERTINEVKYRGDDVWWTSVERAVQDLKCQDSIEREDHTQQQEAFVVNDGICNLLFFAERFFKKDPYLDSYKAASALVNDLVKSTDLALEGIWQAKAALGAAARPRDVNSVNGDALVHAGSGGDKADKAIVDTFYARLLDLNSRVNMRFKSNLHIWSEKHGDTLTTITRVIANYFSIVQTSLKRVSKGGRERKAIMESEEFEDHVAFNGKLMNVKSIEAAGGKIIWPRQALTNLDQLLLDAKDAQVQLKKSLVLPAPKNPQNLSDWKAAQEWAATVVEPGKPISSSDQVSRGLVDFLEQYGATVFDPGLKAADVIQRKMGPRYGGDPSRIRDLARLGIVYKSFSQMKESFLEMLGHQRFKVVRLINRFRRPTGLGRKMLIVNVMLNMERSKHLCELQLFVFEDGPVGFLELDREWWQMQQRLRQVLLADCGLDQSVVPLTADYMLQSLESRAIEHGDVVFLRFRDEQALEVADGRLHLSRFDGFSKLQAFVAERAVGDGLVTVGEVIYLRNVDSGCYLEVLDNGQLFCTSRDSPELRVGAKFKLEEGHHQGRGGAGIGFMNVFGKTNGHEEALEEQVKRQKAPKRPDLQYLHSKDQVRLRTVEKPYYVSALVQGDDSRLRCQHEGEPACVSQNLAISRRGCTLSMLDDIEKGVDSSAARKKTKGSDSSSALSARLGVLQRKTLVARFMATEAERSDFTEGGSLASRCPEFQTLAAKQANAPGPAYLESDESEEKRGALVIAALLRCIYNVLTQPTVASHHSFVLMELLGNLEDGCPTIVRLVQLVTAAQLPRDPGVDAEADLITAWLPAKFMRLLTVALCGSPCTSTPIGSGNGPSATSKESLMEQERLSKLMAMGSFDRHGAMLLYLIGGYIRRVLVPPLLRRLREVMHRPLIRHEFLLLREMAKLIQVLCHTFVGNAWRAEDLSAGVAREDRSSLRPFGNGTGRFGGAVSAQTSGAPGDAYQPRGQLSAERKAEIFAEILPGGVVSVMVQGLLTGMHCEAMAYQQSVDLGAGGGGVEERAESKAGTKLLSSLVSRSIHALSSVMQIREGSQKTCCEYEVCEAVAQALKSGAQVVPRARIHHLMTERATEKLRAVVAEVLKAGLKSEEQVLTVAWAWTGFLPVGLSAEDGRSLPEVRRHVVATTSHFNLAILASSSTEPVPRAPDLQVVSVMDLTRVSKVVIKPIMRQFLGLYWDPMETVSPTPLQVFIFESALRRKHLQEFLCTVPKACARNQNRRGPPEVLLRGEVSGMLAVVSQKGRLSPLMNITFIRPNDGVPTAANIEVMVLSRASIAFLTLSSFLAAVAAYGDYSVVEEGEDMPTLVVQQDSAEVAHRKIGADEVIADTDSEEDDLPRISLPPDVDLPRKIEFSRPAAKALKGLKGVWFMAEAEPRARLQFQEAMDILFFSDGCKQRWRQQLAGVLHTPAESGNEAMELLKDKRGWQVVPTEKETMEDVLRETNIAT
eukprot:TRINITY_DN65303_c0_g1_i1.p1 TRINITY_DN65303_c0_g1~~TRINITY_DN65303_c0_g1_i1.p1  ORF type:complete len:2652 (+),score=607.68 TRINITY_DN65303_c0_g1_i1:271-8226(+)